jgi:hypothetical protein
MIRSDSELLAWTNPDTYRIIFPDPPLVLLTKRLISYLGAALFGDFYFLGLFFRVGGGAVVSGMM